MIAITNSHFGYKMQFITERCMKITIFSIQKPDWELNSAAVWTVFASCLLLLSLLAVYMHFLDIRVVSLYPRLVLCSQFIYLIATLPFYGIASSLPLSTCAFVSLSLVIVGSLELRLYVPYLIPIGALLSVHSRQASSEPWVKVGRCSSNLTGKRNYCLRYNLLIRPSRTAAYSPSWEKKYSIPQLSLPDNTNCLQIDSRHDANQGNIKSNTRQHKRNSMNGRSRRREKRWKCEETMQNTAFNLNLIGQVLIKQTAYCTNERINKLLQMLNS